MVLSQSKSLEEAIRQILQRRQVIPKSIYGENLLTERAIIEKRCHLSQALLADYNDADRCSDRDIARAAQREATHTSTLFAIKHFPSAKTFFEKTDTLRYALSAMPEKGMALEFGVYSGSSLRIIAAARSNGVYGFDSFEGLPETWRSDFEAGKFAMKAPPEVPGADLVVGWFDQTLPKFLAKNAGPVALLHVDCDLYSSTVTVLEHCGPRLVPGSILIFDEYFNFAGWEDHEHRAWQEYAERWGVRFTWLAYMANDEQVVVRIDDPGRLRP
ncbi:hypothetical protein GGR52DRAFT_574523 [Hypoxylon sp. FL1284]|nr:hypothetical protein GGR52DRAFT_574523 [Hypoxylon sp. FL1284]